MDFPLDITLNRPVIAMDEFKQTIYLLLKTRINTFLQDYNIGSLVPEHSGDVELLEYGIEHTLKQIPGTSLSSIKFSSKNNVIVEVMYKDEIVNFTFGVESENN